MKHRKFPFPYHVEVSIVDGVILGRLLFSNIMVLHGGQGEQLWALTWSWQGAVCIWMSDGDGMIFSNFRFWATHGRQYNGDLVIGEGR